MARSGQITPLSQRIVPLDVEDHVEIIKAEIRQARETSAGALDNALKTAERALGAVAPSDDPVRTLESLRAELVEALATAHSKEHRLREQLETERGWSAVLRDELTERETDLASRTDDAVRFEAEAEAEAAQARGSIRRNRVFAAVAGLAVFADLLVRVF